MNFERIAGVIDITRMQSARVALIGGGGSVGLAGDLVRSGLGHIDLYDFDVVAPENLARQAHLAGHIGLPKVEAVARQLRAIHPQVDVSCQQLDFTQLSELEWQSQFSGVDLLIFATDRFTAQAKGNELALCCGIPALWIGLYAGGQGGEVIFWHPDLPACYRCLCANRYTAHAAEQAAGGTIDPASAGATIFDIHYLDAIAGQLAVGLLTRGADNRFGRLIDQLGDRNFIQVKIGPDFAWRGRDVLREQLGVPADHDTFFAWNAAVRRDPDGGNLYCPDCAKYRGVAFQDEQGVMQRVTQET